MPRYVYVALSDPKPGEDEAFNSWYDGQHIDDILDVPGFVSARRFQAIDIGDGEPKRRRYLTIYEVEADDPAAVIADLRSRRGTDRLVPSDSLDLQSMFAQMYVPLSEKQAKPR